MHPNQAYQEFATPLSQMLLEECRGPAPGQFRGLAVMFGGSDLLFETPAFSSVADLCLLLPQLLAGGEGDERMSATIFALNGAIAECRDPSRDDDSLRAVLQMCMRRLLT